MKPTSNGGRCWYVVGLALLGLSFYALVLVLVVFGAFLLFSGHAHAQGTVPWTRDGHSNSAALYASTASSGLIDDSFTGSWFDPANTGQGLMLEVLPDNQLLAIWLAFSPDGQQSWFIGVGTYSGNTATVEALLPEGGRWIPNFDPNAVVANDWGSLTFTFSDSNHGTVDFNSVLGYGVGSMNLERLTEIAAHSATDTPIGQPVGIVADGDGNVYFSSSPNRIFKIDAGGGLTRVAGSGEPGYSGDGGPATAAQFNFPLSYPELAQDPIDYAPLVGGLALDAENNLYVADAYNNRVRKIDANGIVTTIFGTGAAANSGDGGQATKAWVYWPQGVAVDELGTIYVSSAYGPLRRIADTGIVSTLVGSNCGYAYLGPGLCAPTQIAVDASRNVYAPDAYCRVRRIGADGSVVTVAGADQTPMAGYAFTCGYSGDGGPATGAAMSAPYAVAAAPDGTLYIADTGNHCIRKVASGIISTFAGSCTHPGFAGDGGAAVSALLNRPRGIAVGADGSVYIADTDNRRIRRVAPDGTITTIAGNGSDLLAQEGTIGPAITGAWFDPAQSGHGLMLEALSDNRLLAFWFAFDPDGNESWFGGVGTYSGNTATIDAIIPTGGVWILTRTFAPVTIVPNPWGKLTFTFSDCHHGVVDFQSVYDGFGNGSMNLTRLTLPAGLSCR